MFFSVMETGNPELGRDRTDQQRLWGAVLMQAVYDYVGLSAQLDERNKKRVVSDATAWLASNDEIEMNSFLTVCRYLDLDPEPIRQALFIRKVEMRKALQRRLKQ